MYAMVDQTKRKREKVGGAAGVLTEAGLSMNVADVQLGDQESRNKVRLAQLRVSFMFSLNSFVFLPAAGDVIDASPPEEPRSYARVLDCSIPSQINPRPTAPFKR
ncbi:unnamed protein product [Calypogeia fissa]